MGIRYAPRLPVLFRVRKKLRDGRTPPAYTKPNSIATLRSSSLALPQRRTKTH